MYHSSFQQKKTVTFYLCLIRKHQMQSGRFRASTNYFFDPYLWRIKLQNTCDVYNPIRFQAFPHSRWTKKKRNTFCSFEDNNGLSGIFTLFHNPMSHVRRFYSFSFLASDYLTITKYTKKPSAHITDKAAAKIRIYTYLKICVSLNCRAVGL